MTSIKLQLHVGPDGILKLEVPVGVADTELEVMVIVQPLPTNSQSKPEDRGWPPGFFDETFGSIPDFPNIEPEGDYEIREELE